LRNLSSLTVLNLFEAALSQSRAFSASIPSLAEDRPKSTKGLQPKILNENPPTDDKQNNDVKKHNQEMSSRAERSIETIENEDAPKDKKPARK